MRKIIFPSLFILLILGLALDSYASKIIEQPRYKCYISLPKQQEPGKPLPVLICLPGWGVEAKNDINLWVFPADKKGFFLIELDVNYNFIRIDRDVKELFERINNIINALAADYNIDKNNLFIAGTSAGGMMAITLSLLYPNTFKAMGVISGGRLSFGAEKYISNAKGQLYYFFHGKQDKSIPIGEFYSTKRKLEKQGAIIEFSALPQGAHTLPSSCYKAIVDWFYQLYALSPS